MKIVLDTNVLISGIFWKGAPSKILELWTKDKIQIVVNKKILDEYFRILQIPIITPDNLLRKFHSLL